MGWSEIGQLQPNINNWQMYLIASLGTEVFRVSFLNLPAKTSSWILLRPEYAVPRVGFERAQKFYPDSEPQILHLPIPQPLIDEGITVRHFWIKKSFRYRVGRSPDGPYIVKLEQLF